MVNRVIKLVISLFVFSIDWLRACACHFFGRKLPGSCVVLYYHSVAGSQRERFVRQIDAIERLTKPISASHKGPLKHGERCSAITFDDGFRSVIENALPSLQRRRIPATIFVPTGCLGQKPSWMGERLPQAGAETVLSSEQLSLLRRNDSLEIGSHSVSHPNLLKVDEPQARHELRKSKADLEGILQRKIDLFSFPHGAHNAPLLEAARQAGYTRVFTILPSFAFLDPDEFAIGRVCVDPTDWPLEFNLKLLGAYRWLALTQKRSQDHSLQGNAI